jgi:hypothetical protein
MTSSVCSHVMANLYPLYGPSHTVGTRQSMPLLCSHLAKTRVMRPYEARSKKHPNLPPHLRKWQFCSAAGDFGRVAGHSE